MDSFEVDRIGHITDRVERYNLQTMRQEQTDGCMRNRIDEAIGILVLEVMTERGKKARSTKFN